VNESDHILDLNQSESFCLQRKFKSKREIMANISWESDVFNIYNPQFSDDSIDSYADDTLE